ncbi:MAG: hypothetical protein J7L96_04385 [Bacteroidales bacterium]|nr:hypothetical protein [Bacteroidales bacterium]
MLPRYKVVFVILGFTLLIAACETDPVIYIDSKPIPVIYGIFDNGDSIHYLKVGRSFGAANDPLESASVYDSLFFTDLDVKVRLTSDRNPKGTLLELEKVTEIPKDAGIFHFPGQVLYRFEKHLMMYNGHVVVEVKVPDLPIARAEIEMVRLCSLSTPKVNQQFIYLVPASPLRVHWSGNPWNEIDVAFEFIEDMGNSTFISKWVHIQNANYFDSPHEKYREMKITYEEFIREVLLQIPRDDMVKQTFLGYISITVLGGDANMVQYKKYLNGYTDFNIQVFSNIENGIGLVASRTSFVRDSLRFDYTTRQTLIKENRLRVLKISKWN